VQEKRKSDGQVGVCAEMLAEAQLCGLQADVDAAVARAEAAEAAAATAGANAERLGREAAQLRKVHADAIGEARQSGEAARDALRAELTACRADMQRAQRQLEVRTAHMLLLAGSLPNYIWAGLP
jgi:di/tripeptidase